MWNTWLLFLIFQTNESIGKCDNMDTLNHLFVHFSNLRMRFKYPGNIASRISSKMIAQARSHLTRNFLHVWPSLILFKRLSTWWMPSVTMHRVPRCPRSMFYFLLFYSKSDYKNIKTNFLFHLECMWLSIILHSSKWFLKQYFKPIWRMA